MTCCAYDRAADTHFGEQTAQSDLARYREHGPDPTTKALRDLIGPLGPGEHLLDVGAGVGALSFELLTRPEGTATLVDAAGAYVETARREADRRGLGDRVQCVQDDLVVADDVRPADIVAMDRAVCCYPEFVPLLQRAVSLAGRMFAVSYPRYRLTVRAGIRVENLIRRIRGSAFRTYAHDPTAMHAIIAAGGFRLRARRQTFGWSIEVWDRVAA